MADNKWQVMGESYVHGLMDAEAFLGPLPGGYVSVSYFNPDVQNYGTQYLDENTVVVYKVDPRLRLISMQEGLDGSHASEIELDTEQHDPIFSPSALEARGIKQQQFALV